MSLLFIDGFDHYATADLGYKYFSTQSAAINTTYPRRAGSQCLGLGAGPVPGWTERALSTIPDTVVVGMAVRMTSLADTHHGFRLRRELTSQATVTINTNGSISVKRGSYDGTVLGTSAAGIITVARYAYIEFKIYVHDSAGTYEVRVNDGVVLSGSSVDTMAHTTSGVDELLMKGQGLSAGSLYIDDLYIDDANFHGDSRVDVIMPNGAGQTTEWTPSPSGTDNYANVDDDAVVDEDSTYNVTDVTDEIDTFTFATIEPLGTDIHGVAINVVARKDDAGSRTARPVCVIDSTEYTGDEVGLYDSYSDHQHIWEIPPDISSGAWVEAEVNAAEFGYKMTG